MADDPPRRRLADRITAAKEKIAAVERLFDRIEPALDTFERAATASVENLERKAAESAATTHDIDKLAERLHELTAALTNVGEGPAGGGG